MAITVDFDSNPRTIYATAGGGTVQIRFVDKSSTTGATGAGAVINSWAWTVGGQTSAVQNPIISLTAATGYVTAAVTVGDSSGDSSTSTRVRWLKIVTGTFTPPAANTAYRNITLFVYERSVEAAPKSTCICRTKSTSCGLYFKDLQVSGAITKAGKATFDIVDGGTSSAVERDLFESLTTARYKNIAIIAGYDVLWSGKITRSDKERMSQPGTSPQKAVYHCEAYSDIKKMSDWNIVTPKSEVGKTPGQIITDICAVALGSGEPNFIGTKGGYIDTSGSQMQMTLADTDKLTAFSQVTNATDYDWRTRLETMLFTFTSFNGTNTATMASMYGVSPGDLVNQWLLFPTNLLKTGLPNYKGVLAWGLITNNSTTTITATITGAANIPLATDNCLVVGVPRLDFSTDLQEPTSIRTFTNSVNCQRFADADDKVDLFTKIIAKGKSQFTDKTIAVNIPAKDAWNSTTEFFNNTTVVSQLSSGYIYSYDGALSLHVYGHGWAKLGSLSTYLSYHIIDEAGTFGDITPLVASKQEIIESDGTPTTSFTLLAPISGLIKNNRNTYIVDYYLFLKDPSVLGTMDGSAININIGGGILSVLKTIITDPVCGRGVPVDICDVYSNPHFPGCLVSNMNYSESSPDLSSAIAVHGIITKTVTTDTATTLPDLEVAATNALLQGSQYYQKSTMLAPYYQWTCNRVREGDQITGPAAIREGQRITIVPFTGATAVERQVVIWEFDGNSMVYKLTLGDYQKDVYNVIDKTTSASQKGLI